MPTFYSNGVRIRYEVWGEGAPIVLVHGFASSIETNWENTGWVRQLSSLRRVVAMDCRGHGRSDKPHDPAAYGTATMAEDAVRLMDHLGIERADVMGYSMGGFITLVLLTRFRERFRSGILGGIGSPYSAAARGRPNVVKALLAEDRESVTDPIGKSFRVFAEAQKNDLKALAACMRGGREQFDAETLGRISMPVLIVVGENDALIRNPEELAEAIPGSEFLVVPGKDHLSAVGSKPFKQAVLEFLGE